MPGDSANSFFRGCPALFEQIQEMHEGLFVAPSSLLFQLSGTLVQLCRHLFRFLRGTTHGGQSSCDFGVDHRLWNLEGILYKFGELLGLTQEPEGGARQRVRLGQNGHAGFGQDVGSRGLGAVPGDGSVVHAGDDLFAGLA